MAALLLYHLNPIARLYLAIGLNRHAALYVPLSFKGGEGKAKDTN